MALPAPIVTSGPLSSPAGCPCAEAVPLRSLWAQFCSRSSSISHYTDCSQQRITFIIKHSQDHQVGSSHWVTGMNGFRQPLAAREAVSSQQLCFAV